MDLDQPLPNTSYFLADFVKSNQYGFRRRELICYSKVIDIG